MKTLTLSMIFIFVVGCGGGSGNQNALDTTNNPNQNLGDEVVNQEDFMPPALPEDLLTFE